jgi:hypothetical protein
MVLYLSNPSVEFLHNPLPITLFQIAKESAFINNPGANLLH